MHRQYGRGRGGGRSAHEHAQQADEAHQEAHQEERDPAHWSTSGALCAGVVSSLKVLFSALTWLVSSWWSSTSDSSFWPDWPSWTSPSSETPSSPEPPSRPCEPLLVPLWSPVVWPRSTCSEGSGVLVASGIAVLSSAPCPRSGVAVAALSPAEVVGSALMAAEAWPTASAPIPWTAASSPGA